VPGRPSTFFPDAMRLSDFLSPDCVSLNLRATSKTDAIAEMVSLLGVDERTQGNLLRLIERREQVSTTGIGRGFAIPHCRSLSINRLRLAFGRHSAGVDFGAPDQRLVTAVFLIVAPPTEVSNQYLPVLAKIAQLAKEPEVVEQIRALDSTTGFFALLDQKGV
jgi:mannitol/fructose-specific phosphotransferase system IIA component (Ntr-type)